MCKWGFFSRSGSPLLTWNFLFRRRQDSLCSHVDQLRFFDFLEPDLDFKTVMSRFERQVSWLPLVAPTAELDSRSIENNLTFDSIWQPKSSFAYLPTLPETPPTTYADLHSSSSSSQIQIESIIDQRRAHVFSSPSPPPPSLMAASANSTMVQPVPLMKASLVTRSKVPIRSQEKNSRAISPSPYESALPSQKRTKSSTNMHQAEPVFTGISQYERLHARDASS